LPRHDADHSLSTVQQADTARLDDVSDNPAINLLLL
jgi:hypothetical protein